MSNSSTVSIGVPYQKHKQVFKLALKILVTAACLFYVTQKIDFSKTFNALYHARPFWLFAAVLAFVASKMLASLRLNIYFTNIKIYLSSRKNMQLYWLGMFYNLFLPGSIGGDAYKVVRLTREYEVPYRLTASAVLLDRLSGLAALGFLAAVTWAGLFRGAYYSFWVLTGAVVCFPLYYLAVWKLFPKFLPGFWPTLFWGFAVQILQVISMWCVLESLGVQAQLGEYILIFLVSSVFAVLPFTIGGLGARELIFVWGASIFLLDNNISVTASLLFYLVTIISSLFGLPYVFIDPLKKKPFPLRPANYDE